MPDPSQPESPVALDGVRVLELGARPACRVCGSLLAQMGAEVVAVESAAATQAQPARRAALVAGKRCITLRADDRTTLDGLIQGSDVVIVSSDAPPTGLPLDDGARAGRIVVDVHALTAPYRGPLPDDLALQALSGMMELTGMADGPPCPVDGEPLEMIAALHAATGVLAALRARARDGLGQRVSVSLMDCAISSHGAFVSRLALEPDSVVTRIGNRHPLASPWNVFRARDGWLLVCMASEPQWQRACELMGDPGMASRPGFENGAARQGNLDAVEAAVQAWVGTLTLREVIEKLQGAGIPYGAVTPVDGFPREANLEHRNMVVPATVPESGATVHLCGSPLLASRTAGRPLASIHAADGDRAWAKNTPWPPLQPAPRTAADDTPPLAGIRVLELGHYTTAPLATRYLADLGAEVIKVEPPGGEVMRGWSPQRHGQGGFFIVTNTGKRSLVLDLKSESGMNALERLVRDADVLVENLKPGALARMGLDYQRMQTLNPGFIYCAVSGFGVQSIYPGRPAYDTVVQAMSGIMDRTRADGEPVKTGMSSADVISANFAVTAVLAALVERDRSGLGQFIDVSMQDVAAWSMQLTWNGASPIGDRCAVRKVRDGYVVLRDGDNSVPADAIAALDREQCRARWPGQVWPVLTLDEAIRSPLTGEPVREVSDAHGRSWPVLVNPIRLSRTPLRQAPIISDLDADRATVLGG